MVSSTKVASKMDELGLEFRTVMADELSFVLDAWLKSYRGSPWAGVIRNHKYYEETRGVIEDLLARGAKLLAAVVKDTQRVAGFICYELKPDSACVHFVYVKDPYRRMGIGKYLVGLSTYDASHNIFYTFRTRASKFILPGATYAPEIARRKEF